MANKPSKVVGKSYVSEGASTNLVPNMLPAWQELLTECNRFMMDRWQQGMDAQKALLSSASPMEAIQIQTDFVQNAIKEYSEETMYLFQLACEPANLPAGDLRPGSKRRYDDVPL